MEESIEKARGIIQNSPYSPSLPIVKPNLFYYGSSINAISHLLERGYAGKFDLIYIDPPYNTGRVFKNKEGEVLYTDDFDPYDYISMITLSLFMMRELLSEKGSIYLHINSQNSYLMRIIMDRIFSSNNFINEIVWKKGIPNNNANHYSKVHDIILYYGKSTNPIWNPPFKEYDENHIKKSFRKEGKRYYRLNNPTGPGYIDHLRDFGRGDTKPPTGRHWSMSQEAIDEYMREERVVFTRYGNPLIKKYLDELRGLPVNTIWDDCVPPRSGKSLVGYTTEKPDKLIERILLTSSNEGSLVGDFFSGSGVVAYVAENLNREWVISDIGDVSHRVTKERLNGIDAKYDIIKV